MRLHSAPPAASEVMQTTQDEIRPAREWRSDIKPSRKQTLPVGDTKPAEMHKSKSMLSVLLDSKKGSERDNNPFVVLGVSNK